MKPFLTILIACVLSAAVAYAVAGQRTDGVTVQIEEKKTAYDNIIKTRKIRCGYNYYEPVIMHDPNTGDFSGIYPEIMAEIQKATGLEIEWAQEVGWGEIPVALETGKIDAMCAGNWASARTGVQVAYSAPVFYNAIEAYVRAEDHRFDGNLALVNTPEITISALEGSVTADIAQQDFPLANVLRLPILQTDVDQILNVAMNKADITFLSHGTALGFMKNNPGKIRRLSLDKPLRVFAVTTSVNIKERELLSLLNTAQQQLQNSGMIDRILDKYENDYPGSFTRVAKPYEIQNNDGRKK